MQGGRGNIGRTTVPMSGKRAAKLSAGGQPQPVVHRPQAASAGPRRSGSVEITSVDSAGLVQAGRETTGGQPVQRPQPSSPPQREVYPGQRS